MLNEKDLHGVYVPIITPFDEDGELDAASFYNHAYNLFQDGIDGLVVNGTTGESPTIASDELGVMFATAQAARDAAHVHVPLVVGTGTNDTRSTVRKTEEAGKLGADSALVVVPYYNKPSQQGIIEHFRRVASVGVPVILYEVPHRTGIKLELDTVRTILELDGVIGMKDSTPNTQLVSELTRVGSKPILCGEDTLLFEALQSGAKGVMSASANVETERFVAFYRQFLAGQQEKSQELFEELLPLIRLLFQEPNPAPLKWLLEQQGGIETGTLRLPLMPVSEGLRAKLASYL
ncbi:4-hydroxy-tetrahydrodipicolinate synthase [Paenibacillus sp. CGMCC 1.16610]|uniref:4-hydroxy-tetrahydrodipicolinate synthase n=1 Tax=Paenibacillus anseongense TaxID=2682845 RepID=A0ABW9UCJ1_9BACL|nr:MULTISPECIES: 4-hydroxy-tetrahydrodipicolinate synthase [Paenibacillus]MBA2938045.1 4-hydroxy-tetrahydrodipicolinate synthase [Paenibacillus sp. CGMCC 1.16610]MVQ37102.1 4-hydroxy-tetrahydrodipicolinate synthase [Paenibacillus anseongense]